MVRASVKTDDKNASATLRYFGYWNAKVPGETTDHTNLFICGTGDPCSMQELVAAKAAGQDSLISLSNSEEFDYFNLAGCPNQKARCAYNETRWRLAVPLMRQLLANRTIIGFFLVRQPHRLACLAY